MRQTGETLLDETLKMMKQTEDTGKKMGVSTWVNLLSGAFRVSFLIPFIISGFSLFLLRSLASISLLLIFGWCAYLYWSPVPTCHELVDS
jgi:hypothetical protein